MIEEELQVSGIMNINLGGYEVVWRYDIEGQVDSPQLALYSSTGDRPESYAIVQASTMELLEFWTDKDVHHWSSDWNGDEVGFSDVDVVGLYTINKYQLYIDMDTMRILQAWEAEQ